MSDIERELKLVPLDPGLLDILASVDHLGEFVATRRWRELQRNSFFDTASRALAAARVGFRRRTIEGQLLATWTLKADGEKLRGVMTRTEIELQLDADLPPALAIGALRQAAQQRGARELAEEVQDALAAGGLPLKDPFLETQTDRAIVDLEVAARGWSVELALDRMLITGHAYSEIEIEAELKRGDEAALDAVRSAIEALGEVRESDGSKLSRAMAHVQDCHCAVDASAV
jgi:inorganic triphosphatase YgiF